MVLRHEINVPIAGLDEAQEELGDRTEEDEASTQQLLVDQSRVRTQLSFLQTLRYETAKIFHIPRNTRDINI